MLLYTAQLLKQAKMDVKRMEGDVTKKDNVLLSLCCSKNSTTNRRRRKEGFIYRNISQIWLSSRLHTVVLPPLLSWSETWGWRRMRLGWGWRGGGVKVSLPDKKDSEWKKDQRLGGVSGQPHWSVLAFFGPVALVSGEVPGLLGAGFAEAASLPDSCSHRTWVAGP